MNSALLFLLSRSLLNAIAFRLRRLRHPKYLAGALIGAAYFYFYIFRFAIAGSRGSPHAAAIPIGDLGPELGALALFVVFIVFAWLWPGSRAVLHFTEAEIAWLFPAPIDRTALIRFKLLKSQLGLLLLSFVMTLLTGRGALGPQVWLHLLAWWIIFSTLQMHRLAASFALQRLFQRGLSDWKRRCFVLAATLSLFAAIFFWRKALPTLPAITATPADATVAVWMAWIREALHAGPAPWLLWPFRTLIQPWFAGDASDFLRAAPGALALLALHYFWVIRAQVSFEEASLAVAQKRAAAIAARVTGDLRAMPAPRTASTPVFSLAPFGFAPVAFLWKHLLSSGGRRTFYQWIVGSAGLLIVAIAITRNPSWPLAPSIVTTVAGSVFAITLFTNAANGSRAVRRDLAAIDLLKTFPISGWKFLLGSVLGPVLGGSALQLLALAILTQSLFATPEMQNSTRAWLPIAAASVAFLTPAINLTLTIIPVAATLLFPAWFRSGEANSPGLEAMGLRLLMVLGQLVTLLLALVPATILGAAAWMCARLLEVGPASVLLGSAVAALALLVEAGIGIAWLGRLFDCYDPSEAP